MRILVIAKIGRPSLFSQKLAERIVTGIVDGNSLRSLCLENDDLPDRRTVLYWIADGSADSEAGRVTELAHFFHQYTRAQQLRAEMLLDEAVDISDDGSNDWMEKHDRDGNNVGWAVNGEAVQRSKLRVDTRLKLVEKMHPKKYAPISKTKVSGDEDNPTPVNQRIIFGWESPSKD